jgi:signal transduction histidine kinase
VAHELRGRLNVLSLNSDGLLSAAQAIGTELSRAWLLERLERLDRALRSMRELMERLLEVQQLQLDTVPRPQVDLRTIVLEVLHSDSEALRSARCTCELVAPEAVTGDWDALQLRVAIGNLVGNALKFGAGRPIAINVGVRNARAFVRVADQGSGVQPEDCDRIFERFERASDGEHANGWGLGLWLVRNIARAHGGDVTVHSAPDEGAAFTLSLPLQRNGAGT